MKDMTPGPWHAEPSGIRLGGALFGDSYVFDSEGETVAKVKAEADAYLIALVPEMLAALKAADAWFTRGRWAGEEMDTVRSVVARFE